MEIITLICGLAWGFIIGWALSKIDEHRGS